MVRIHYLILLLLFGCTLPSKDTQHVDEKNYESLDAMDAQEWAQVLPQDTRPPVSVLNSLKMTPSESVKQNIAVSGLSMRQFLMAIAARYHTNITVDPSLTQTVALRAEKITLLEIFQQLSKLYRIDYERTSSGWVVQPARLTSKIYTLDTPNIVRWGHTSTTVARASNTATALALNGPSSTDTQSNETTNSAVLLASSFDNSKNVEYLQATLNSLRQFPAEEAIMVNPSTGMVTVQAYAVTHQLVDKFIRHLNYTLSQQVLIEARILEVALSEEYKSGVNLSGTKFAYQSGEGMFQYYTSLSSFKDVFNLIRTQGRVNVLSSPRLAVAHQQRAIIKVGNDSYYATGTSQTNSMDGSTSQVNNLVAYQPFFSGLVLDVTPFVDGQGGITLHVHPYISVVTPDLVNMPLQNTVTGDLIKDAYLRMASTQIRETDTIIKAKSGELIVIAGLMTRGYNTTHKTPGGVTPVLASGDTYENTEIVILIRPVLMNSSKWKRLLAQARSRVTELDAARV